MTARQRWVVRLLVVGLALPGGVTYDVMTARMHNHWCGHWQSPAGNTPVRLCALHAPVGTVPVYAQDDRPGAGHPGWLCEPGQHVRLFLPNWPVPVRHVYYCWPRAAWPPGTGARI